MIENDVKNINFQICLEYSTVLGFVIVGLFKDVNLEISYSIDRIVQRKFSAISYFQQNCDNANRIFAIRASV